MSTYHKMWEKIKELNKQETENWINVVQPARGQSIDFRGVRVRDSDVLEALRNWLEDLRREEGFTERAATRAATLADLFLSGEDVLKLHKFY